MDYLLQGRQYDFTGHRTEHFRYRMANVLYVGQLMIDSRVARDTTDDRPVWRIEWGL